MQRSAGVLRCARHRADALDLDFRGGREAAEHPFERIGPHEGRGRQIALGGAAQASTRSVGRQVAIEIDGAVEDHSPNVALDFDQHSGKAERPGVQTQVQGHDLMIAEFANWRLGEC